MGGKNDTFGQALLEALDGGAGNHAIERDDGRIDRMAATDYFTAVDAWPAAVGDALRGLHGRVLDVGCGAGRHALYLNQLGCDVVAIDPSPGAVAVCRRRGLDARLGLLGEAGLLEGEQFDGVVMLGANLGLLASPTQAVGYLDWLAARCAPGAMLIGESKDVTQTEEPEHLAYHRRAIAAGRPPGQLRLRVNFAGQVGEWFSYWHLTPDELGDVTRQTPWRIERIDEDVSYIATLLRD